MSATAAIALDRDSAIPLYRQIELQIRASIDDGRLRPGARLPGIRSLAADLGVGRVTVATAYEQLTAEGYLVGRVGSGTRVALDPPRLVAPDGPARQPRAGTARAARFDLRPGAMPLDGVPGGFPAAAWEARLRTAWRRVSSEPAPGPLGATELRISLSAYLDAARGTRADPDRVVVGSGPRVLLAALVAALDREGGSDRIPVVGLLVPADPELRALARRGGAAALDVPTNRAALHAAAGVVLVEDDRPALLRLTGPATPAIQGSLAIGRTVLLGALHPLVVPGVSIAWMVLPTSLVEPVADHLAALDGGPSAVEQSALAGWIAEGGLDRRIRRLRHALLERRRALEAALRIELGELAPIGPAMADPSVAIRLAVRPAVRSGLPAAARTAGVAIAPIDDRGGLTLGHAALSPEALSEAVRRLGRAIDALDPEARRGPPAVLRPLHGAVVRSAFPRLSSRDDGIDPTSAFVVPGPSRLGSLGRAMVGRRGPAAKP